MTRKILTAAVIAITAICGLTACSVNAITDLIEGKQDVFSLKTGDCFNDEAAASEQIESVKMPACTEEHDNEVYGTYNLTDADFPSYDSAAILDDAEAGCGAQFEGFVGAPIDQTSLDYGYYYPSPESWENGDREILCLAYDLNGPISEPLRGKGPAYPYEG